MSEVSIQTFTITQDVQKLSTLNLRTWYALAHLVMHVLMDILNHVRSVIPHPVD